MGASLSGRASRPRQTQAGRPPGERASPDPGDCRWHRVRWA